MSKCFTLIELLIVIAIIGILASILMPSLSKSREIVLTTSCMNNQRNIMLAVKMYAEENNSKFDWRKNHQKWIDGGVELTQSDNEAYWGVSYSTYLSNGADYQTTAKVFKCPKSEEVDPWVDFEINGQYTTYGFNGVSYNNTRAFFDDTGSYTGAAAKNYSTIENPSELILMHDSYESMLDGNGDTPVSLTQWSDKRIEYFRHLGKMSVLWLDGHATIKGTSGWTWEMYVP